MYRKVFNNPRKSLVKSTLVISEIADSGILFCFPLDLEVFPKHSIKALVMFKKEAYKISDLSSLNYSSLIYTQLPKLVLSNSLLD